MMRLASLLFAAAVVFAAPLTGLAFDSRAATQRPFPLITVAGEGSVTVKPDVAYATGGITTEGKTPREASEANARLMTAIIAAAKQAGIEDKDIRTAVFSIQPVHAQRQREGAPQVVGYRAMNQVSVTIRDLTKVGEVLDALIAAGATNMGGVQFGVLDPGKLMDQARTAAFADAKRKAELYARAAGGQVGRAVAIQEADAESPQPMMRWRTGAPTAAAAPPTPIASGEETLRMQISVTFELLL